MISVSEALDRLKEGNRRFVSGVGGRSAGVTQADRSELVERQEPFAAVIGCSDSRVPPEIVFDQGLGDLFVIRVAGNVAGPSQIGSVEFAVASLGVRLVVVLGHSSCGAIRATLETLAEPEKAQSKPLFRSPNLGSIVDCIRPSVETLRTREALRGPDGAGDYESLLRQAVRANVRAAVHTLRERSEIIEKFIQEEGLQVVGAEYSLETGVVEFF